MEITIGEITAKDIPYYIGFLRAGFGEVLGELGTDLDLLSRIIRILLIGNGIPLRLMKRISGHEAFVLIARYGNRPIGCLTVVGRGIPSLTGVYILPEFRGHGLGSALIKEAVKRLQRLGYSEACATPLNGVARHLIEDAGFIRQGFTAMYERSLPLNVDETGGFTVRRRWKSFDEDQTWHGRPYRLRLLGRLLGIRVRRLTATGTDGGEINAVLFALPRERVGEVHPVMFHPGAERGLIPILNEADEWFSRLGKEVIKVFNTDDDSSITSVLSSLGFEKKRDWERFTIALQKKRGG